MTDLLDELAECVERLKSLLDPSETLLVEDIVATDDASEGDELLFAPGEWVRVIRTDGPNPFGNTVRMLLEHGNGERRWSHQTVTEVRRRRPASEVLRRG